MPRRVYRLPLERCYSVTFDTHPSRPIGYSVTPEAWCEGHGRSARYTDETKPKERQAMCEGVLGVYYTGFTRDDSPARITLAIQPLDPRQVLPEGTNEAWRMHDACAIVEDTHSGRLRYACMLDTVDEFLDQCGVALPSDNAPYSNGDDVPEPKHRGGRYAWWVELD